MFLDDTIIHFDREYVNKKIFRLVISGFFIFRGEKSPLDGR